MDIKIIIFAFCFMLIGCMKNTSNETESASEINKNTTEKKEIVKYNDFKLCLETESVQKKLNVNPSSYPEYNENLRHSNVLNNEIIRRNINCYEIKNKSTPKKIPPLTPAQKTKSALYTCKAYVQHSLISDPKDLMKICIMGYKSTQDKCNSYFTQFINEAQKLTKFARAEYIEIAYAFRTGCNMK